LRTVDDYASGKILESVDKTEQLINQFQQTGDLVLKQKLQERSRNSKQRHYLANLSTLKQLLKNAQTIAIGPRICLPLHPECQRRSDAVFLDELADALINVGKAQTTTSEEALTVLKKGRESGHPSLVSVIAGKSMELCNSCQDCCILWKREHLGIESITK
jgi:hypothetical protein